MEITGVVVRPKDRVRKCSCGGNTYPVGCLVEKNVIIVEIRCRSCQQVVETYRRYTYRRRDEDV